MACVTRNAPNKETLTSKYDCGRIINVAKNRTVTAWTARVTTKPRIDDATVVTT